MPGTGQFSEQYPQTYVVAFPFGAALVQGLVSPFAGAGGRVDVIIATNNDTIDHVVGITFDSAGVSSFIQSVTVPAGAGYNGAPAYDCLLTAAAGIQAGFPLQPGVPLYATLDAVLVSPIEVDVLAFGGTL